MKCTKEELCVGNYFKLGGLSLFVVCEFDITKAGDKTDIRTKCFKFANNADCPIIYHMDHPRLDELEIIKCTEHGLPLEENIKFQECEIGANIDFDAIDPEHGDTYKECGIVVKSPCCDSNVVLVENKRLVSIKPDVIVTLKREYENPRWKQ